MWPYWFMLVLSLAGLYLSAGMSRRGQKSLWQIVLAVFIIMIGFRHQVGGDWYNYIRHLDAVGRIGFVQALGFKDPGYYALNWWVSKAGGTVYWVNLVCATLTIWGVSHFAKSQPLPWLALLVAVPYMLVVVAMGYTRQSAALGLVLIGLTELGKHRTRQFVFWILLGALFHKSAVLMLPIAALSATKNRMWTFFWVGVTALAGAYLLVLDSADTLWENYVEADYHSSGALIRVLMNAVPSVLLLLYRNQLFYDDTEKKLWLWMAVFSLLTVPLVMVSSTAVDRVALYFIPLQLFVFSRLPFLLKKDDNRKYIVVGIITYYSFVQFVWLNFASHAHIWLPYQNYFFVPSL